MARKKKSPGRFIVLEGIDGSGTTTQAKRLKRSLTKAGVDVVLTREPSTGPVGRRLKRILTGAATASPETIALLFAADRREHLTEVIEPALQKKQWVICDRYALSSYAYQSQACPLKWVYQINDGVRVPDLTFLLDLPAHEALERIMERDGDDREMYETLPQQKRIRKAYRTLAETGPRRRIGRIRIIDARMNPDAVELLIWTRLLKRFAELRPR